MAGVFHKVLMLWAQVDKPVECGETHKAASHLPRTALASTAEPFCHATKVWCNCSCGPYAAGQYCKHGTTSKKKWSAKSIQAPNQDSFIPPMFI